MRNITITLALVSVALAGCSDPEANAMPGHQPGMKHQPGMNHGQHSTAAEPGHGGFAAIQEVVQLLDADPDTDWSQVNLDALRQHLVDMDRLTLYSDVATELVDGGAIFTVTGDERTTAALQRMVPTHAAMTLAGIEGWTVDVDVVDEGVRLSVVGTAGQEERIRGLGFFGIMTLGAEHPTHHVMMALGQHH